MVDDKLGPSFKPLLPLTVMTTEAAHHSTRSPRTPPLTISPALGASRAQGSPFAPLARQKNASLAIHCAESCVCLQLPK